MTLSEQIKNLRLKLPVELQKEYGEVTFALVKVILSRSKSQLVRELAEDL